MLFSKRYSDLLSQKDADKQEDFFGTITFTTKKDIVGIMRTFSEPKKIRTSRYNKDTIEIDAFSYALLSYNHEIGYDLFNLEMMNLGYGIPSVQEQLCGFTACLFDVIELQYDVLSTKEKKAFANEINKTFSQNDVSWLLADGKMVKIDAKQFEVDLKRRTLEKVKELTDCDPKFKSAYNELQKAIEFFSKGEYPEAIVNAEKSYESVMKIVLGSEKGNAKALTEKVANQCNLPNTINPVGFKDSVLMSLPFIRNNAASHGAGAVDSSISKSLANLAINLAASLCTYLIEENKMLTTNQEK